MDVETMTGREDCEANICAPCLRKMPRVRAPRVYSARRAAAATINGPEATFKRRLRFE